MTAGAPAMTAVVARTVELDPKEPIDLVSVAGDGGFLFEQEGHGLAARGEAVRVHLPRGLENAGAEVTEVLRGIRFEDGLGLPGTGPIAVGALPFAPGTPASMVIPSLVVGRAPDGRQWLTTVGPPGAAVTSLTALQPPAQVRPCLPDGFALTSPRSHGDWEATVAHALAAVDAGRLAKVVVAREVAVEANRPIVLPDVLERLRALYPSCVVFASDGFVGATPELLVERRGRHVRAHPLAGTYPRSGDPHADDVLAAEMLASAKERREHRYVIEEISSALGPLCRALAVPEGPSVMPLRNVLHLGTEITGELTLPAPTALELAATLHPTAAVGGTPKAEALDWLERYEHLDRGRYAGPVGWVDARGDGTFAVGIRSAEIDGCRARLFAGVGVVRGSDPRRELIETQLKFQAMLAALVRP